MGYRTVLKTSTEAAFHMPEAFGSGACFSPCGAYRYVLWRRFDQLAERHQMAAFIGLNPSTADEDQDDPTIRRCIRFAKDWGFRGLMMLNLFALRATDPKVMKAHPGPESDDFEAAPSDANMFILADAILNMNTFLACGRHGLHRNRLQHVLHSYQKFGRIPRCLGVNGDKTPKHPLYIKAAAQPIPYEFEPPVTKG